VETATAIDHTVEGSGVLDVGGKRVFVPGVIGGEQVDFRRRRQRRNFDEGELVTIRMPSASRVAPRCAVFGRCGGCSLQHVDPAGQLALKERSLLESLRRIGGIVPERVLPAVTEAQWGYRRRARLAVRDVPGKGRVLVGFRERDKPYITDMQHCETLDPALAALLPALSTLVGGLSLRARIPQIELARGDEALAVVFRVLDPPTAADRGAIGEFARQHVLQAWLQPGAESTLAPLDPACPPADLAYGLPDFGLRLAFGPLDFVQVHAAMNRKLIAQALSLLAPGPDDRVLDLYCGIGNFSLPLARSAGEVLGMELAAASVARAAANAQLNGISNAHFVQLDLAGEQAAAAVAATGSSLVLLDPPRNGALELLPALGRLPARRLVYVSCHPGTLARDARILAAEHGFRLRAAGVLDMFPQTAHVESMALFERD
jgi:23S rRNA (uracil1939-C5)-methyltransferase